MAHTTALPLLGALPYARRRPMPDRFAFPPRASADALALALGTLPGVIPARVAPCYLIEGARWVVEARCDTRAAVEAAFRLRALRIAEWPASEVVLEVEADPPHLVGAPPDAVHSRERGDRASSSPYPPRPSAPMLSWTAAPEDDGTKR